MTKGYEIKKPDFTPVRVDNLKIFKQRLGCQATKPSALTPDIGCFFFIFGNIF
jgi:hypothetical protein